MIKCVGSKQFKCITTLQSLFCIIRLNKNFENSQATNMNSSQLKNPEKSNQCRKTILTCSQQSWRRFRRRAFRKERFDDVQREGQGLDGSGARPDDDALDPEPDEGRQRSEGHVDVGVIGTGLLDHAAELGVAVSAEHGENAAHGPDDQGKIDRTGTRTFFINLWLIVTFAMFLSKLLC